MTKCILFFLTLGCLIFSCDKNDPVQSGHGSLELIFKARFGTEPLVQGTHYDYFGLGTIFFDRADFYFSSMKLLNTKDTVLVKDVDYISFMLNNTTIVLAEEGLKVVYDNIPSGSYESLSFNIGLTPEQNKTKPADYQTTHPLAEGTRYWSGWSSYIFSKTEGKFNNGAEYPFTYHSGFDNAMRALHFTKNVVISNSQNTSVEIQMDYKELFKEGNTGLDIPAAPQIHNTSSTMLAFMDRFQNALSVK